jgi:uncharacterized protein (TIGR00106 family)
MLVLADICVTPLGVGVSTSRYVAACVKVLQEAKLDPRVHAYGTNVEGQWARVFAALRECHRVVHGMGVPRISTTVRLGTCTDRAQTIEDKMRSVEETLGTRRERKARTGKRSRSS